MTSLQAWIAAQPFWMGFGAIVLVATAYFVVRYLLVAVGAWLFVTRTAFAQRRRVYRRDVFDGQLRVEIRQGLVVLGVDGLALAAMIQLGLLRTAPLTIGLFLGTFAVMFAWFEVWFYATHRLMHLRPLYFIHAQHHVAKVTTPFSSMSFSILERVVLLTGSLGFAIVLSQLVPLSFGGFAAYFLLNFSLNVYGHLNVDPVPHAVVRTRVGRCLNTPTYHAMHHGRYEGHYGLFTPFLDRLFGHEFPDYLAVHERVARGDGLTRMGERLEVEAASHPPAASTLQS